MKSIKKSVICAFLFVAASPIYAQFYMNVHKKDGQINSYDTNKVDSVTFEKTSFSQGYNLDSLLHRVETLEKRVDSLSMSLSHQVGTYTPPTYYNSVVRSIQRLGYGVPRQSLISMRRAYDEGFRILLCDLVFTKDSVPVCFHDNYIGENQTYVCYSDGTPVPMRPNIEERDSIVKLTYDELNAKYDFGVYAGNEYKGTKLLKFGEMLLLARNLGVELYVEVKQMDEKQAKIACKMVQQYGMTAKTSWSGDSNMKYVVANIPTARVSTMPKQITEEAISELVSFKTGSNSVFFFGWNVTILNDDIVSKLIENEIEYEMGTIDTTTGVIDYFNQGDSYYYCTGIESNLIIAGKVMFNE